MLPDPTVPASLLAVLELVRGSFTTPTFRTFTALVTGLMGRPGGALPFLARPVCLPVMARL